MNYITRGTTPTVEIQVEGNLTDFTCELSFGKYGKPTFTVDNQNMDFAYSEDENLSTCSFHLTQEQTLALKAGKTLMQMRAIYNEDAIATETVEIEVLNVIEQSIIEDVYDTDNPDG